MEYYELATLELAVGVTRIRLDETLNALRDYVASPEAGGAMVGCWISEFGAQNRLLVMRGFESREAMHEERERVLMSSDPFLPREALAGLTLESFRQFRGLPPVARGDYGPLYEFRTYVVKTGGVSPTVEAWLPTIPARTKLSPLITAMYALDGRPRFIHIWAYRDHQQREAIRAEAFRTGVWPAPGAPEWLTRDLRSEINRPTSISPLR